MRIFIGSSLQALEAGDLDLVTELIKEEPQLQPIRWDAPGTFAVNAATWEGLLERLEDFDGAAFIFREDDVLTSGGAAIGRTRDNVVLEFGLFSGFLFQHYRTRSSHRSMGCAIFRKGNPTLPTDLKGITYISLENRARAKGELSAWAQTLREQISEKENLGPKQIAAIVQAMAESNVGPKQIYALMDRLGVVQGDVDRVLKKQRAYK